MSRTGPIESFLPMILFAVLFGLSMDYEVFLVSRIQEERGRGYPDAVAIDRGVALTMRLITAAAIMCAVFLSFAFGPQWVIKEFGVGLAAAIFIDAAVVRLFLVPLLMYLCGPAARWCPRWLEHITPRLGIEGPAARPPAPPAATPGLVAGQGR